MITMIANQFWQDSILEYTYMYMYMYIVPVNEYSYVVYLHICFIFQQFKTSMHFYVTYNSMFTMSLKSEDLIKKNVKVSRYCSLCFNSCLTVTQWYAVHGHFPFRHITASIYKACTLLAVGMLLFPLAFQT